MPCLILMCHLCVIQHSESNGDIHMEESVPVNEWTTTDVAVWLHDSGFGAYIQLLTVDHCIDGSALLRLDEADLRRPPVSIPRIGDIKRLALSIEQLKVCHSDMISSRN